jgi:glycosyltransferase involved in cell wall biosynthesis
MPTDKTEAPAYRDALIVGVCTFRNPEGLAKLMRHLAHAGAARVPNLLIVVDNDVGGAGIATAEALAPELPFPLRAVLEPRRGIPFARNRLIEEALCTDFRQLAMLDDDEYPAPGWLAALESEARKSGADLVGGPVLPVFAVPPRWPLTQADFGKDGGRLFRKATLVMSSANVLVTRRLIERWSGDWFRPEFAETGGSDSEFFRRTALAGHRHAIARDALAYEDVTEERARRGWLVRRSYRSGGVLSRARLMHHGLLTAAFLEAASVARLLSLAVADFAVAPTSARGRFLARLNIARAAGRLAGFFGFHYREYMPGRYRSIDERRATRR